MSAGNRLERNGELIRKYFASHMDYSQECNVYEKLKGTGLSPEVTFQYDGLIEKKYIEGPSFAELYEQYSGQPEKLAGLFETFCDWYGPYRAATNLLLGNIDPSKFLLTDHGFVYLDFEHCRPGFAEADIAHMVKWMGVIGGEISESGVAAAKLFICVCSSKLHLTPDRLEKSLRKEFEGCMDEAEDFICYMTSAGVVNAFECSESDFAQACAYLSASPERYIACPASSDVSCPGFERLTGASFGECLSALARKINQPRLIICSAGPESTAPMVKSREKVIDELYSINK